MEMKGHEPEMRTSEAHDDSDDNDDDIIEIDYDMIAGAKAKRVKALHITERFMKTNFNDTNHNPRQLKRIFSDLQQLDATMETMHVQLDTTQITGTILSLAITPHLTALDVKSGLTLLNQDDRTELGKVIYEHEYLGEIRLHNLVVKERLLTRWNKNSTPPLDILVPAFTSIVFLNVLELSCKEEEALTPDVVTVPPKPMLSLLGIKELCHSLTLQRLELSRLHLTDNHFGVLVEQLSQQSSTSCLTELILNENENTDSGMAILASLLFKPECALEHLECYQSDSVVVGSTVDMFEEAIQTNTTLKKLRIHLWGDDEIEMGESRPSKGGIPFYMQLNQKGRKCLIDKQTSPAQWLDLIVAVKDEPSQLYYCLRNSGYWWKRRSMYMARTNDIVLDAPGLLSPLMSPSTPSRQNDGKKTTRKGRTSSRLEELKNRHGNVLQGLNINFDTTLDDLSDAADEDDGVSLEEGMQRPKHTGNGSDSSLIKDLDARHLPQFLSLGDHEDLHNSVVSLGAESYVQDLLNQKEKRPDEAREEVLEEALEELEYATANDKLPPGMSEEFYFHRVLERLSREKAIEEAERERKLDALLERELIREIAQQKAVKQTAGEKGRAASELKSPEKVNGVTTDAGKS